MNFVITLLFREKGKPSLPVPYLQDIRSPRFKVHDFWVESNGSGHLLHVLEWQSVKAESEKDGPIVEKINVIVLKRLA
jgi:hypothetical protein